MLSAASGPGGVEAAWRYAAVVGESYRNPDGQSRQEIIRQRARPGDAALLIPDPNNPRHSYAVKVCLATGEQIGYLDREWGTQLQWDTMNGGRHAAIIHRIYGGTLDKPSRGVVLRVASVPDGAADTELAAIVERARTDPDEWDATGGPPGREVTVTIRVNLELAASRARIGEPPRDPTDEAAVAAYRDAILARLAEPEAEKTSHPSTIAVLILAVVALLVVGAVLLKVGW
jgi:hypothetical protein